MVVQVLHPPFKNAPFVDRGNSVNVTKILHFVFQHECSQIDSLDGRYDRRLVDDHRRHFLSTAKW